MHTLHLLISVLISPTTPSAITRYTTTLPQNALILPSETALKAFTSNSPDVTIHNHNGGYAIRQGWDGAILAYTADPLSKDLDPRMASARLFDRLLQERGMSETRLGAIFEEVRACSHPHCVHPGVIGKYMQYTGYHWRGGNHRCI
ncbi:hypothetical protein HFD88_001786 [Aspergillus terreus]|nr:hypothetical protein HFD88_001786 [Aspergillus terreus]